MKELRKRPAEVNSWEYLYEHLYERSKRGGFDKGFKRLKKALPFLNQFKTLDDLLALVAERQRSPVLNGKAKDDQVSNYVVANLLRLYRRKRKCASRPASVELLLLILWNELTKLYEALPPKRGLDERFADIYWELILIIKRFKFRSHHYIGHRLIALVGAEFNLQESPDGRWVEMTDGL